MPRSPDTLERIRDGRRTAILDAAERVFEADGIASAKMSDIARKAGLSHGLVYHYFPSKDALIEALVHDRVDEKRERMAALRDGAGDPRTHIARLVTGYLELCSETPPLVFTVMHALTQRSLPAGAEATIARFAEESFGAFRSAIADAQERGLATRAASAEELTTAVIALLRGYTLLRSTPFGLPVTAPSVDTVLALLALRPDERDEGEPAAQVTAVGARATARSTNRLTRSRAR